MDLLPDDIDAAIQRALDQDAALRQVTQPAPRCQVVQIEQLRAVRARRRARYGTRPTGGTAA